MRGPDRVRGSTDPLLPQRPRACEKISRQSHPLAHGRGRTAPRKKHTNKVINVIRVFQCAYLAARPHDARHVRTRGYIPRTRGRAPLSARCNLPPLRRRTFFVCFFHGAPPFEARPVAARRRGAASFAGNRPVSRRVASEPFSRVRSRVMVRSRQRRREALPRYRLSRPRPARQEPAAARARPRPRY